MHVCLLTWHSWYSVKFRNCISGCVQTTKIVRIGLAKSVSSSSWKQRVSGVIFFFSFFFLSDLEKMQISFKLYVMYYIKQFTILICKILHNFKHNNTQCVPLYNQIPSSLRGENSYCGLLTSHLRNIRLKKYFDNMLKKHKKYSIYQVFKSK